MDNRRTAQSRQLGATLVETAIAIVVIFAIGFFGFEIVKYFKAQAVANTAAQIILENAQVSFPLEDDVTVGPSGQTLSAETVEELEQLGFEFADKFSSGGEVTVELVLPPKGDGTLREALNSENMTVRVTVPVPGSMKYLASSVSTEIVGRRERLATSSQPRLVDCYGEPITTGTITPEQYQAAFCPCDGDAYKQDDGTGNCICRVPNDGGPALVEDPATGICDCPNPERMESVTDTDGTGTFVNCECRDCSDVLARPTANGCGCECVDGADDGSGSCQCTGNYLQTTQGGETYCECNVAACPNLEYPDPANNCACECMNQNNGDPMTRGGGGICECPPNQEFSGDPGGGTVGSGSCVCRDLATICPGDNLSADSDCECTCKIKTGGWSYIDPSDFSLGCQCDPNYLLADDECNCDPSVCGALASNSGQEGSGCNCACTGTFTEEAVGSDPFACQCRTGGGWANLVINSAGTDCECDESICGANASNSGREALGCDCECELPYGTMDGASCVCDHAATGNSYELNGAGDACVCKTSISCPITGSAPDETQGCSCDCTAEDSDRRYDVNDPSGLGCTCLPEFVEVDDQCVCPDPPVGQVADPEDGCSLTCTGSADYRYDINGDDPTGGPSNPGLACQCLPGFVDNNGTCECDPTGAPTGAFGDPANSCVFTCVGDAFSDPEDFVTEPTGASPAVSCTCAENDPATGDPYCPGGLRVRINEVACGCNTECQVNSAIDPSVDNEYNPATQQCECDGVPFEAACRASGGAFTFNLPSFGCLCFNNCDPPKVRGNPSDPIDGVADGSVPDCFCPLDSFDNASEPYCDGPYDPDFNDCECECALTTIDCQDPANGGAAGADVDLENCACQCPTGETQIPYPLDPPTQFTVCADPVCLNPGVCNWNGSDWEAPGE